MDLFWIVGAHIRIWDLIPTAAAKPFNVCVGGQIQKKQAIFKKQRNNLASSEHDTLIGSVELAHLVHGYYKNEMYKNSPLPKINTHMK